MIRSNTKTILSRLMPRIFIAFLIIDIAAVSICLFIITPQITSGVSRNMEDGLYLIKEDYLSYINNMKQYLYTLKTDSEFLTCLEDAEASHDSQTESLLVLFLHGYQTTCYDQAVFTVIENRENGTIYHSISGYEDEYLNYLSQNPYYLRMKDVHTAYYSPIYPATDELASFMYYSMSVRISSEEYIVTVFWNMDNFLDKTDVVCNNRFDQFALMNVDDTLWLSDGDKTAEELTARISEETGTAFILTDGVYFTYRISALGGYAVAYASFGTAFSSVFLYIATILALSLILFAAMLVVVEFYSAKYLKNLTLLAEQISSFSFEQETPDVITSGDEVELISRAYHNLLINIDKQKNELLEKNRELTISEYKTLTTQLDPHFVGNTMSIINILAQQGRDGEIVKINSALLEILRANLSVKDSVLSKVRDEIRILQDYVTIMTYRYQNAWQIDYEISDDAWDLLILKNALQMLVENSILHGFLQLDKSYVAQISILIYRIEDEVIMEVNDNGCGIREAQLMEMTANQYKSGNERPGHIGLGNIYQRLSYIFGNNFHMAVDSEYGYGTTVVIAMPICGSDSFSELIQGRGGTL